jgi:CBS domain-containing protein
LRSALVQRLPPRRPGGSCRHVCRRRIVTVGDLCTRSVTVAPPDELLVDAARRMRDAEVSGLVVVDNGIVPVGMLTERDVIGALVWQPRLIGYLRVVDAMSRSIVTVHESEIVGSALRRMEEQGVLRLQVVDATGKLVGVLTFNDVLEHLDARHSALVTRVALARRRPRLHHVRVRA